MIKSSLYMALPLLLQMLKHALMLVLPLLVFACSPVDTITSGPFSQHDLSDTLIVSSDLSADGRYTLLADSEQVCLIDNHTEVNAQTCLEGSAGKYIELVGIAGNNKVFFTSNRININLYETGSKRHLGTWHSGQNIINDIAISRDGDILLLGFRSGQAGVIDVSTGGYRVLDKHRLDINSVSLSDNGQTALTGSSDKTALLWNIDSGENLQKLSTSSRVNHVALNNDGSVGFVLDAIAGRHFFDARTGARLGELDTYVQFMEINDSSFSSDGKYFLTGAPKQKIQLWRIEDGALMGQWESYKIQSRDRASVLAVAYEGENNIITVTNDAMLERWPLNFENH